MAGCYEQNRKATSDKAELPNCYILLVEDCSESNRLVKHLLEKAGARVNVAVNGQIAVDMVQGADDAGLPYDLILMDMHLPVLNGYEATRRLRADGQTLPIIALTAYVMPGDREKCLQAGCSDYTMKPVDRALLIEKIRAAQKNGPVRD